jgi:HPt (histidine-containing phosphotransfer) domain-containing protein
MNSKDRVPPVEWAELLARFGGDRSLVVDLIEEFVKDLPGRVLAVRDALALGDHRALEAVAHALREALASFSAKRCVTLARELERLGRQNKLAVATAVFTKLQREVETLRRELVLFTA